MNLNVNEIRQEHRDRFIGPQIVLLLERVVEATAVTYPASEYSDARVWNKEALEDALQDWVEVRLVGRGDLAALIASAASIRSLRAALTTSFGQFLTNRRRRTSASNLYKRTLARLRTDQRFRAVASASRSSDELWTLAGGPEDRSTLDTGVLVRIACELSDTDLEVVRYGPHSLKSSPILREGPLGEFLHHLFSRAEGALDLSTIADVMRRRFGLVEFETAELSDQLAEQQPGAAGRVETQDVARSVLSRLGLNRVSALKEFELNQGDFRAAALSLGLQTKVVSDAVSETMAMIAEYADSPEEARVIYGRILESLF
jgi:hypothetical protein